MSDEKTIEKLVELCLKQQEQIEKLEQKTEELEDKAIQWPIYPDNTGIPWEPYYRYYISSNDTTTTHYPYHSSTGEESVFTLSYFL